MWRRPASGAPISHSAQSGGRLILRPKPAELALAAAAAVGDADLVGVDLLPLPDGGYSVLELNGAVDFTAEYSLDGTDVFRAVASMIEEAAAGTILATARSG